VIAASLLADSDPLPEFQGFNWSTETQHVFRDNLRRSALRLIADDRDGQPYVVDFAEFTTLVPDPSVERVFAGIVRKPL